MPVVATVLQRRAQAVVGDVRAPAECIAAGIPRAAVAVRAVARLARQAVSRAAEIVDGAEIAVVAAPGQERPDALSGGRVT